MTVPARGTLLQALRDELGRTDVKDGCAPQGQCGCCTVLIDGHARVACVTPIARAEGREVTTMSGLDPVRREALVEAFDATAASQCGFCTPGIVVRLAARLDRPGLDDRAVRTALAAHLCRCTGFQPIVEAALIAGGAIASPPARDLARASERATLESGTAQRCSPDVVRGDAPFADDTAPTGALVALGSSASGYVVATSDLEARAQLATRQGRNSTIALSHPVALPDGEFDISLQTTFVEPAYLEPDASWCEPGGEPASPFGNAGAFGAKRHSPVALDARALADAQGRAVAVRWTREAVVLRGEKRPPLALGVRADGTGTVVLGWTRGSRSLDGLVDLLGGIDPRLDVSVAEVAGPLVGVTHRGAAVAEVLAALAVLRARSDGTCTVETANGAWAEVRLADGRIEARAHAGDPRCVATTRSYVIGAVHQAYSMVTTEGLALDEAGTPVDLTIRSFGVTPARDFPHVDVELTTSDAPPLAVGTAVFAAALAAVWLAEGTGPTWPTRR